MVSEIPRNNLIYQGVVQEINKLVALVDDVPTSYKHKS